MTPCATDLSRALSATWPAAETTQDGVLLLRRSPGGGRRVQAAEVRGPLDADTRARAERVMRCWGQRPMFRIADGDRAVDDPLAHAGYRAEAATRLLAAPLRDLSGLDAPRLTGFPLWPPLAVMHEIWAEGGICADRLAIMSRCNVPRCALLGRNADRPAGAGFAAVSDGIAFVHALTVRPTQRRCGVALRLMGHAARWAGTQGAATLAVAVEADNAPALALYRGIGMTDRGGYHYRVAADDQT